MERSYDFTLPQEYQAIDQPIQSVTYPIRNAQERHWRTQHNTITELIFDGRYGYLYYYEFWMDREENIPVYTYMGDLHLVYPLLTNSPLRQLHKARDFVMDFVEGRGTYLYLAKGEYSLKIPKGHHIMVGFILDAGLFRPPANRHFSFLKDLIIAKKMLAKQSLNSTTFRIGEITKRQLQLLFNKINPHILDNEYMLLKYLIFLIQLSRFKLLNDPSTQTKAERTRELLEIMVSQQGSRVLIKDIAQIFITSPEQLSREYQNLYRISIKDDRNKFLLEYISQIIIEHEKLGSVADEAGFSGPSEMNRFIRKMTGLTSSEFKHIALKELTK